MEQSKALLSQCVAKVQSFSEVANFFGKEVCNFLRRRTYCRLLHARAYTPKFVQVAVTRHRALCECANVQMCKCVNKVHLLRLCMGSSKNERSQIFCSSNISCHFCPWLIFLCFDELLPLWKICRHLYQNVFSTLLFAHLHICTFAKRRVTGDSNLHKLWFITRACVKRVAEIVH